MGQAEQIPRLARVATEAFEHRRAAGLALVYAAEDVARACHDMARRFQRGGKLIAFGNGAASTDAQHIAVEFVHPVIVGKRAFPAISLTNDVASLTGIAGAEGWDAVFAHQLRYLARSQDIALGISQDGRCRNVLRALEVAKELGLLTLALIGGGSGPLATSPAVDHRLLVRAEGATILKELQVTVYHILWELVHVFFEQPGVLDREVVG
jgi:D-sedoheptulose 7-phosphate isomerase